MWNLLIVNDLEIDIKIKSVHMFYEAPDVKDAWRKGLSQKVIGPYL